ncbi:carbamoyltransferase HypF [Conexibacter sp. CPCC 206217]|uniref:carbamoyltransferase HypF n=1 Tax=Conexibacter sp. CPCC 206217 TaxID=3064574 RepID=UPI0027273E41|nr:carbamoyltransferase HypF [Conexibacter sp. CPCC 206217]MDO8210313.1 carbamoyltransferase HypF [Conexibacter sp. CPCC 206217]
MTATRPRSPAARRLRIRVEGTVQGVGFRPYVHRLARELELGGAVGNDERGVVIEVEGDAAGVGDFLARLAAEAPPLAHVERVDADPLPPTGARTFAIVASERHGPAGALVAADAATCDDCLAELRDPADRRHRYPFVNCTNCGPRFTIVRDVPYDRPRTTMAAFAMCPACQAEYDDPADRRFHAQPNACPVCGPRVRLLDAGGRELGEADRDAVAAAARLLADGAIVAIKGLGGYHLACRADDDDAVDALRRRKHREDRPFALMAADLAAAHRLVQLDGAAQELLGSSTRPIVLAPRRVSANVTDAVAPGMRELGVMLPYTPLHHLLLADLAAVAIAELAGSDGPASSSPLVLTSGNLSDEPIAYRDDDARRRLAPIADAFLVHDRPIQTRTDDSVVRAVGGRPLTLRRSRGYVPAALALPLATARPLLACGAELKNTFCVARGERAWVSHHVGDLRNAETLAAFRDGVDHFQRLFAVRPELVVHDLHPDYLSTSYALACDGVDLLAVQHHHAHLAACLAEHGETATAVGAIYDGAGFGADGTVWGGEILVGDARGFTRAGSLWPVRLPGGDRAAREPWRMACAWLVAAAASDDDDAPPPSHVHRGAAHESPPGAPGDVAHFAPPPLPAALAGRVDPHAWSAVARMAATGLAAPTTTSMGRLFDAVAALCGMRTHATYEGQAAIELEALADRSERTAYPLPLDPAGRLDARPAIRAVAADMRAGVPASLVSARFHNAVATATAHACAAAARAAGTELAVLSGGVFQNVLLLERTTAHLRTLGLRALAPERMPPGDGGIAYGQAAVAAAALAGGCAPLGSGSSMKAKR